MPRKVTKKLQRQLQPDRRYQSVLVQRLINKSMLDGKKLAAERAVYTALETAAKKLDSEDPLAIFEKALKNVSPNFEVKSRRVGGSTIRFRSQFRDIGSCTMHLVGWYSQPALAVVCLTHSVWHWKSLTLTTKLGLPSRRKKTPTRWLKLTVPLRTLLVANCYRDQIIPPQVGAVFGLD